MATALVTQGLQFPDNSVMYSAGELERTITISTPTTAIDLSLANNATFIKASMGASTTVTFSNPPTLTSSVYSFSLMTTNSGAGYTLAFGNTIKWSGGVQPARTTTNGATDVWTFFISANTYYGSLSMANVS